MQELPKAPSLGFLFHPDLSVEPLLRRHLQEVGWRVSFLESRENPPNNKTPKGPKQHTVHAEAGTELTLERAGPVIELSFKTLYWN